MILYKINADKTMSLRDIQIVLELLKDRGIDASFEGFEQIKVGSIIPSLN